MRRGNKTVAPPSYPRILLKIIVIIATKNIKRFLLHSFINSTVIMTIAEKEKPVRKGPNV